MIVRLTRFVGFTLGALGGFSVSRLIDWSGDVLGISETLVIILFVILGCSIGYLFGGILGRELARWYDHLDERLRTVAATDLILGTTGTLAGLLVALLAASPLRMIDPPWLAVGSTSILTILLAYGGLRVALVKADDLAGLIGRPSDEDASAGERMKIIDTSAVIDGRLGDLVRVSALRGRLVVPAFVIAELQTLADSADELKRARGRRGLDILETLRGSDPPLVEVFTVDYREVADVDAKLLRLARDTKGMLVTVDYNLTKAARIQDIAAYNFNEIANALRPNIVTGDEMSIAIVREGKEPAQGVGYLEDGTMVVIEKAADRIGEDVDVVVSSVFQASAGRMVFARVADGA